MEKKKSVPRLMLDLCKGKPLPFIVLQLTNLLDSALDVPLQLRWEGLKDMHKVRDKGVATKQYYHESLCSGMVKQIYCSPSEVLINTCYQN